MKKRVKIERNKDQPFDREYLNMNDSVWIIIYFILFFPICKTSHRNNKI